MHSHFPVALSQPNVTRAVIGSGLYLTVLGLFALAIGSLIRHTAGAITTVIGLVLVIFNLTGLLPYSWGAHIHAYMPTVAGVLITQDKEQAGQLLTAWQGFGVFCAWTPRTRKGSGSSGALFAASLIFAKTESPTALRSCIALAMSNIPDDSSASGWSTQADWASSGRTGDQTSTAAFLITVNASRIASTTRPEAKRYRLRIS